MCVSPGWVSCTNDQSEFDKLVFLMVLVNIWSLLCAMPHIGFASAQKVIQVNYCSIDEHHLRMDCKYALPAEAPEPFCKYTNGERLFDTTDPEEEQHAPFKNRAKVRIFPGNICRLLFKNLPNGKSNFTCNIKYADSTTASRTSVVEKSKLPVLMVTVYHSCAHPVYLHKKRKHLSDCQTICSSLWTCIIFLIAELLLPCSAWSVLLQSCSGLLLTLMTLPMLLEIHWLWTRRQTAAYVNTAPIIIRWLILDSPEVVLLCCVCTTCNECVFGMSQACLLCIMHSILHIVLQTLNTLQYSHILTVAEMCSRNLLDP